MYEDIKKEFEWARENIDGQIEDYRSIIRGIMALPFPKEFNKVDILTNQIRAILCGLINSPFNLSFLKVSYSEDEVSEMVNEIVCYWLLVWLENSANARQTVHSFAKQKYTLKENQKRHKKGEDTLEPNPDEMTAIYRGKDVYEAIIFENESNKENYDNSNEKNGYKKYNFIELCFAENYSNYYLNLLRSLIVPEKPLKTISNTKETTAIEDCYEFYFSFFNNIKNEKNDKLFVIKSLLFFKFEYTFRFLFAYQNCEYRIKNNIDVNEKIPTGIDLYYKSFKRTGYIRGKSISMLHRQNERIIQTAYGNKIDETIELKIFYSRIIMDKTIAIYKEVSPFHITDNWREEDFVYAACFLKNRYKIQDVLDVQNNMFLNENIKAISNYINKFYLESNFIDIERLQFARNIIRPKAQEKNKRKKKGTENN